MQDKKIRKITVELSTVQMIWLHSQHLFQKIEESAYFLTNEIKFFKNNLGVEIKFQSYSESNDVELLRKAQQQLLKITESNEIRLIQTSLHKDLYIKISKEARKEFPKSYIIFLHYETFQNCCRKLQEKFNITSIAPELERLRKNNPNFCFLIAEKNKIDDIEKFTNRILKTQISCASTTFSHNNYKKQHVTMHGYKKTMSVSSLKGSFSDHNEEQCRLSVHNNSEEDMYEVNETSIIKLSESQLEKVQAKKLYEGSSVYVESSEGPYIELSKKLYYANRLQLTANGQIQPVYAYSMYKKNSYNWCICLVTDRKYKRLRELEGSSYLANTLNKIQIIKKIGRALISLHHSYETYSDLDEDNVLIDENNNVYLSCIISKDVPPYTNPFLFDIRKYLMLIYKLFTDVDLTYEMLLRKENKQQYFCSINYKCQNALLHKFLDNADQLFIGDIALEEFLKNIGKIVNSS